MPEAHAGFFKSAMSRLGIEVIDLLRNDQILMRDNRRLSDGQEKKLAKLREDQETVGIRIVRSLAPSIAELILTRPRDTTEGQDSGMARITIPIGDDHQITAVRTSVIEHDKGVTWRGIVVGTGENVVLMWWKDGHLTGIFDHKDHKYVLLAMGGDLHALVELDFDMRSSHVRKWLPFESLGQPPLVTRLTSSQELQALEAETIVIDVMMVYTKRALSYYMSNAEDMIALGIEQTNQTFRNSGLGNISLRLVHLYAAGFDEEEGGESFDTIWSLADREFPFEENERIRNEKRADLVGLIVDDGRGSCGLATRVHADAEEAYFVVHHRCAFFDWHIAHEIGHLLGARHDISMDKMLTPFPYAHAHSTSKWRDILGFCGGILPCIPFWSNPRVLYDGVPTGTPDADNARVILGRAKEASKFR